MAISKKDAVKKAAAAARRAKASATKAAEVKDERERKQALLDAAQHAHEAEEAANELERQHLMEIEEGDRLAAEEGSTGFWTKFKKAVGWE